MTKHKIKRIKYFQFLCAFLLGVGFLIFSTAQAQAYVNASSWTSPVKSYVSKVRFGTIAWTEIVATNSTIVMEVRAGNTATPDGTWTAWTAVTNGQSLSAFDTYQRIQHRISYAYDADTLNNVPGVSDVTISTLAGDLVSSAYDSLNPSNKLTAISWSESLPGTTDVLVQVRTSRDNINWTAWCGPDDGATYSCNSFSYFTDPAGTETIDNINRDSLHDRYFQYKIILLSDGTNVPTVTDLNVAYDRVEATSVWTSPVKNFGGQKDIYDIAWDQTTPTDSSVTVEVRVGNTATPDGTWTAWTAVTSGQSLLALGQKQYLQYRANFSAFGLDAASISEVRITYDYYPSGQGLISSPYDTSSVANLIGGISWTENASFSAGMEAKISLRTADSQANLSSATWYDFTNATVSCTKVAGLVSCPVDTIPAILKDGIDDQWVQYKIFLNSTTIGTPAPTVSDVTLTYVVNATPQVQNVTASQTADGMVTVNYQVRDPDTTTGFTANEVAVTLQYCTA
ncbi:MAG: hypothetical protein Q7T51_00325, partial [Candidatus Moranbacteria bacterium]|nr:hypothetical protein [Candidatus Moranbacteria bacterium]